MQIISVSYWLWQLNACYVSLHCAWHINHCTSYTILKIKSRFVLNTPHNMKLDTRKLFIEILCSYFCFAVWYILFSVIELEERNNFIVSVIICNHHLFDLSLKVIMLFFWVVMSCGPVSRYLSVSIFRVSSPCLSRHRNTKYKQRPE
jgi:hypothetical protein